MSQLHGPPGLSGTLRGRVLCPHPDAARVEVLDDAVVRVGEDGRIRVTDFGLARAVHEHAPRFAGTPAYMAPEHWRGHPSDVRSDQYSFIRAGIPALATKNGMVAGTPEAEIESRWQTERYHGVTDDLAQPVDLAAIGLYAEICKRLAVRVANREQAPKWYDSSVFSKVGK